MIEESLKFNVRATDDGHEDFTYDELDDIKCVAMEEISELIKDGYICGQRIFSIMVRDEMREFEVWLKSGR